MKFDNDEDRRAWEKANGIETDPDPLDLKPLDPNDREFMTRKLPSAIKSLLRLRDYKRNILGAQAASPRSLEYVKQELSAIEYGLAALINWKKWAKEVMNKALSDER